VLPIRPEVTLFLRDTENLISPVRSRAPLNRDERDMIRLYLQILSEQLTADALACERNSTYRA
jgi:hypothetical protein